MAENNPPPPLPGDNPIRDAEQDALDRAGVAEHFGRAVLALDRSEGAVVGVFGPWGSGKTSFVNLARPTLEAGGATVIEFNPWMFSGAEQLVERFLGDLSAELKIGKLRAIGKAFEDYGDALSGTPRIIVKLGHIAIQRREKGIAGHRKKVEDALRKRGDKPILVVLDDVDRLSPLEIRDIFKLVRLTASFPNLLYIVLCDRERVEQALGESGLSGRDYLEKIVQLPFDLPETALDRLRSQFQLAIRLEHFWGAGDFDNGRYRQIEDIIIPSLIRNIRDVRRYAAALHGTVIRLQRRVAIPDVIALESLRVFEPAAFKQVYGAIDDVTLEFSHRETDKVNRNLEDMSRRVEDLITEIIENKYGDFLNQDQIIKRKRKNRGIGNVIRFLFLYKQLPARQESAIFKQSSKFYFENSN